MTTYPKDDPDIWWVFDPTLSCQEYVTRLLERYRQTPTTCGRIRREDRPLAKRLFLQRTPLCAVEAAFHLAAVRRIYREPNPPLTPIRSLYYFLPVIEEILHTPIPPDYINDYIVRKLKEAETSSPLSP